MMTYEDRQVMEGKFMEYARKISCCSHTSRLVQSVPHEVGGDSEEEKGSNEDDGSAGTRDGDWIQRENLRSTPMRSRLPDP